MLMGCCIRMISPTCDSGANQKTARISKGLKIARDRNCGGEAAPGLVNLLLGQFDSLESDFKLCYGSSTSKLALLLRHGLLEYLLIVLTFQQGIYTPYG